MANPNNQVDDSKAGVYGIIAFLLGLAAIAVIWLSGSNRPPIPGPATPTPTRFIPAITAVSTVPPVITAVPTLPIPVVTGVPTAPEPVPTK